VTALSARISSGCDPQPLLGARSLHLWLGRWDTSDSAADFRRGVLARYSGLKPGQLRFATGVHGKPRLINSPRPIEFNVSHSGDWQVCAVSRDVPIGVDIEYCEPQRDVLKLARRFFSVPEYQGLLREDEPLRLQRFYDLWTLKESRVKALGAALAPELDSTDFNFDTPVCGSTIGIRDSARPDSPAMHYCLMEPRPGYRVALCCMGSLSSGAELRLFRSVDGELFQCEPLVYRGLSAGWSGGRD
jgi:phosphopantetheinyl transferase